MDATSDISSPQYFMDTFKVSAAQAADLSAQAKFVSLNRGGGGVTNEVPGTAAPVASPAPSPSALNAQAEYDQLMADRREGKITTAQWNASGSKREQELANLIANGAGEKPAPVAQAQGETHPYLGRPPSANDYGFLHGAGELPAEQVAEITARQEALSRLNLSRSVVQDVQARLRTYGAQLATPEKMQSVAEANYARFTQQCARTGITAAQAEELIGSQFKAWSSAEPALRPWLEGIAKLSDPTMLDYVLQIAISNRAARR